MEDILDDQFGGQIDDQLDDQFDDIETEYIPDDSLGVKSSLNNKIYYNGEEHLNSLCLNDIIPNRDSFIDNNIKIKNENNDLYFMPNDVIDKMSKDGKYIIVIYGYLLNGMKAELTIHDIRPYFDVAIPTGMINSSFHSILLNMIMAEASDSYIEDIMAYPIRGFNATPIAFKRVFNKNLQTRKKALAVVLAAGWDTASDDRNNYHRKVSRENNLLLSDWMVINSYSENIYSAASSSYIPPKICKINAMLKNIKTISNETKQTNTIFIKDKAIAMTWDIETYSERNMGDLPTAEYDEDNAFMICMTFHWKDEIAPLYQICITNCETESDDRWLTIICKGDGSKSDLIKAFALCFEMFRPDLIYGFNDSDYDWPFIIEKAKRFGILEWIWNKMSITSYNVNYGNIMSFYNMNKQQVKITGADTTVYCSYLKIIGCITIDARVCLRKLYPKAEKTSLKYFLEICNLGGKADMPIKKMWNFYKRAAGLSTAGLSTEALSTAEITTAELTTATSTKNEVLPAEGMRHIAHYCVIDAFRCQELMVKRNVINDYRELTSLAYMTLYDAHYYANGKRVCNLLGAYATKKNILISMIPKQQFESGKYPGAFVFPPEKGLTPNPNHLLNIENIAKKIRDAKYTIERNKKRSKDEYECIIKHFDKLPISHEYSEHSEYNEQELLEEITQLKLDLIKAYLAFQKDRPVTGLDFSSLYPSIIMTDNLSPEKIILSESTANAFKALGYDIHNIEFIYNGRAIKGYSIKHNNDETMLGLYPTVLIDLFNKRAAEKKNLTKYKSQIEIMDSVFGEAKKISDTHDNMYDYKVFIKDSIYGMKNDTITEMATLSNMSVDNIIISPGATLEEEQDDIKRKIKNEKEKLSILESLLEIGGSNGGASDGATSNENIARPLCNENGNDNYTANAAADDKFIQNIFNHYKDVVFKYDSSNAKQNAIKVYMNSFYGEAGNPLSPFFLLELAGGVTSSGQYNIKLVAKFVTEEKGFFIKYGDTDSLYLVPPAKYFTECDQDFVDGKLNREEYWSAMVRITMRVMNSLKNDVNDHLYNDNGSRYLKMAYEEVLYPVVFTGKKKYYGIAHENEVNFRPKKLFIRGIDIIKQGQSGLAKIIGNRIMWESMAISNTKTVHDIVKHIITDAVINKSQWNFDDFIKSAAWRPNKKNISVHLFMNRMRIYFDIENKENKKRMSMGKESRPLLYELPEAGDRFNYVLVQKNAIEDLFDTRGCKKVIKVGDKMEFIGVAKTKQLPIDIAFYIKNYVIGICARFINYDEQFYPSPDIIASKELDEKKIDKYTQDAAKKYLEHFIKSLENINPNELRQMGNMYKKIYSYVVKKSKEELPTIISSLFHNKIINYEMMLNKDSLYNTVNNNIIANIEKKYMPNIKNFCSAYLQKINIIYQSGNNGEMPSQDNINGELLYSYYNTHQIIKPNEIITNFSEAINNIHIIAIKYENIIMQNVNKERKKIGDSADTADSATGDSATADSATGDSADTATADTATAETDDLQFMDVIDESEKQILLQFKINILKLIGIHMNNIRIKALFDYINDLKKIVTKSDMRPTILERKTNIKNAINSYFPIEK